MDKIEESLIKIGKKSVSQEKDTPKNEWAYNKKCAEIGSLKLKRRLLGILGNCSIKSLDEIANALYKLGAVENLEEGRKIVPLLTSQDGKSHSDYLNSVKYRSWYSAQFEFRKWEYYKHLFFDRVYDKKRNHAYRIKIENILTYKS